MRQRCSFFRTSLRASTLAKQTLTLQLTECQLSRKRWPSSSKGRATSVKWEEVQPLQALPAVRLEEQPRSEVVNRTSTPLSQPLTTHSPKSGQPSTVTRRSEASQADLSSTAKTSLPKAWFLVVLEHRISWTWVRISSRAKSKADLPADCKTSKTIPVLEESSKRRKLAPSVRRAQQRLEEAFLNLTQPLLTEVPMLEASQTTLSEIGCKDLVTATRPTFHRVPTQATVLPPTRTFRRDSPIWKPSCRD